jgi:hypothetical protein
MNFSPKKDNSYDITIQFQLYANQFRFYLPLNRNLTLNHFKKGQITINSVNGILVDIKISQRTDYFPNGKSTSYQIVNEWHIIESENIKEYNSKISLAEKDKLILNIEYRFIDIRNVLFILNDGTKVLPPVDILNSINSIQ